jgi:Gram-negative bacterial TonB protein C-terminal
MVQVATFLLFTLVGPGTPQAPQGADQSPPRITVSPQTAAAHLLTSGQPKYPPFSLAAGIEGMVKVCTEIDTDGHAGLSGDISGPPSLSNAAMNAISGFRYRPFTRGGKPVPVVTTIAIPFKLPPGIPAHTYPMPHVTMDEFNSRRPVGQVVRLSLLPPRLKNWYHEYIADQLVDFEPAERKTNMEDALQSTEVHLISRSGDVALYLFDYRSSGLCGATGNCPMILVTDDGSTIILAAFASGWGSALHQRPGAPFPDVIFVRNLAADVEVVTGYGNAGGMWGPLLYQETLTDPPGIKLSHSCP